MLEPEIRNTLDLLAAAVVARKLTQSGISAATGVHQSQISRILSGDVKRASKNVWQLCKYYNLHNPGVEPAPQPELPPDIQDAVNALLTGQGKPDDALRDVLGSLAAWRRSLASPG